MNHLFRILIIGVFCLSFLPEGTMAFEGEEGCGCREVICKEPDPHYYNGVRVRMFCKMYYTSDNYSYGIWEERNTNVNAGNFDCENTPSLGNFCKMGLKYSRYCRNKSYVKGKQVVVEREHCSPSTVW